jgi:hypothetical protein
MATRLATLVGAALLAAGCGGSEAVSTGGTQTGTTATTATTGTTATTSTGGRPETCSEREGAVRTLLPEARLRCGEAEPTVPVESGDALFGGDRLTTNANSRLVFTLGLSGNAQLCGMEPGSSAVIRPDPETALRVLGGTVGCEPSTAMKLAAPGVTITTTGTLFSLAVEGETTTIRVYEGTLEVRSEADSAVRTLSAAPEAQACPEEGVQAVVSPGEAMRSTAYELDPGERELVHIVALRVALLPPSALQGVTERTQSAVVTATEDQGRVLMRRNLIQVAPLVAPAIEQAETPPVQPGDTVVGVGSYDALSSTFCRLRAQLPAGELKLYYTPYSFPKSQQGTTSTETGTTSTETGTTQTETTP